MLRPRKFRSSEAPSLECLSRAHTVVCGAFACPRGCGCMRVVTTLEPKLEQIAQNTRQWRPPSLRQGSPRGATRQGLVRPRTWISHRASRNESGGARLRRRRSMRRGGGSRQAPEGTGNDQCKGRESAGDPGADEGEDAA
eukprot:5484817-Prymnesium_polylepis.1